MEQPVVVGLVGADFAEPAHRGAEELDLVDRLPGADPAQLRRPVGAEDDQRQRRFVGLADRRVVVGGRRARGAEQRHRLAARLRRAEREEAGRALVDDHRHLDLRLPPERHRQRRRARAGGDDRAPQPAARQLLDEGRGEGGVGVGRVHAWRRLCHLCGYKVATQARAGGRRARPRRSRRRGPGPAGRCSMPSRSSHSTAAIGRGEEALGGEAVGEVEAARPARSRAASAPPAPPPRSRPGRRGRWRRRRAAPRRSRSPPPGPPTLESLTPVSSQAPDRDRPLGVGAALDALVAGERDRGRRRQLGRLLQRRHRLLGQLDLERLELGQRPLRRLQRPRRRWRRPGSAPPARAPRAPPAPGRRRRRPRASA